MKKFHRLVIVSLFVTEGLLLVFIFYNLLSNNIFAVLEPRGLIAQQEKNLMITALLLGFLVVIPVFLFAIFVGFKYREGKSAEYEPEWSENGKIQAFWWIFPTIIICILAVMEWTSTHKLDPRSAIPANNKEMTVDVVALPWKWLFIYPSEGIATVNYLEIPENTPINFELTGDKSAMNSFWIPQLGGQIYAMTGMITQTHLIANNVGQFRGQSAEISGKGYAGMEFSVNSVSQNDYNNWVSMVQQSPKKLDDATYKKLSKPSENNKPELYSITEKNLYEKIVMQYMSPSVKYGNYSQMMQNMNTTQ